MIGVTALSTLAMIVYPIVAGALSLGPHASGIFIGATVHDVAQVVGAGYSISQDAGDTATIEAARVAMLAAGMLVIGVAYALLVRGSEAAHAAPVLPPWFAAWSSRCWCPGEH